MQRRLFSYGVILGLILMAGATTASADEILLGLSASPGSISISCVPNGPCSFSLVPSTAPGVGGSTLTGFVTNNGNTTVNGSYEFTGGPSSIANMVSSNGGLTFTASGSWLFSFSDVNGDSITNATATWSFFSNVGSLGFNQGTLTLSGGTCTDGDGQFSSLFCSDFGSGATIDLLLQNMPTDLGTLYTNGSSATGVTIENGSIIPVPEPGTLALFGSGLIGIASFVRRKIAKS